MSIRNYLHQYSQLNNVWMTKQLQILDFPSNLADNIQTLDLLPVHHFYGNFVSS